jgi:hypothetical protein
LQYQLSRQAKPLTLKVNPTALITFSLLLITVITGFITLDNYRFGGRVIKPDHRYFSDPNQYLDIPK